MFADKISSRSSRWLAKVLDALLACALMAALLPGQAAARTATALAEEPEDCDRSYEVRRTDTLSKIASKYGRTTGEIVSLNEWEKPYTIYVGQRICIPTKKVGNPPKVSSESANAPAAYFTAGRTKDELLVYTFNYPKNVLVVRVDDASDSVRHFTTVGSFDIADVGNQKTQRFRLPSDLKNASKLFICLKDKKTNHLQCVYPRSGG